MKKYSIILSPEQTIKLLSIGAPIERCGFYIKKWRPSYITNKLEIEDGDKVWLYQLPTAEEAINWLCERFEITTWHVNYYTQPFSSYGYWVIGNSKLIDVHNDVKEMYDTREEATIASIDATIQAIINNICGNKAEVT